MTAKDDDDDDRRYEKPIGLANAPSRTHGVPSHDSQFNANLAQENPTDAGFLPLSGSNRYRMSAAADSLWILCGKTTIDVRGSYYNMTDEFYNPSLLLGEDGLRQFWPNNPWYTSLYNSGYAYYPALDVTSGTGTSTGNRLGRLGREHFQRPDAWTLSAA